MPNAGIEEAFRSGELLLNQVPSAQEGLAESGTPVAVTVLVGLFVIAAILLLKRFLNILPLLADSIFRARGSASLEGSVRNLHDRNLIAGVMLIPLVLITYRYRLYDAAFLRDLSDNLRLLSIAGVLVAWLILRLLLYLWMKPRRRYDFYQLSQRSGYTFFILLMLLVLITVGILMLTGCEDATIRWAVYAEMGLSYLVFLFRRAQILSLSCNPVRTFLYLCGLEILPTAALVVSAVIL